MSLLVGYALPYVQGWLAQDSAELGQPFRVGGFEVIVEDFVCNPISRLTRDCVASVRAVNESDQADHPYFDWTLELANDERYDSELILEPRIFPGAAQRFTVRFHTPLGVEPRRIEVSELFSAPFSGSATVELR